jgi:hypothetical protein
MEDNSFSWMYKIKLNKQYRKFGDLMNFLLDCLVEDENDKICINNFTGRHLLDRISNDLIWRTIEQSRMNAQLASLASALNGGNNTMDVTAESSKKIEVSYTTIADTLTMHYPIKESNLKQPVKDDTLRRSRKMYHDAVKIREVVFLNENIITVKKQ